MSQKKKRSLVLDWLAYFAMRILLSIFQACTLSGCQAFARALSYLAYDWLRLRKKVTDKNIETAFPGISTSERRRIAIAMWENLVLMICEIAHANRKIHQSNWRKFISIPDRERVVELLLRDQPVVFVSGHYGNFEMASFAMGLLGFSTHAIARRLDNPFIHDYIDSFRSARGQYILTKDGSAQEVKDVLDQNGTLMLLADQHAGPKGCWIDFFGKPASCHKAVAIFTLTSNAPLVVCAVRRTNGPLQFQIEVEGIVEPQALPAELNGVRPLTSWYNRCLERIIQRHPDQYWWLHNRWKEPPAKGAAVRKAA